MRIGCMFLLLLGLPLAAQEAPTPAQAEFFETKVRPLLQARCYKCHSAEIPKPKGGFRLDSREALLKGGDTGPALAPKAADSLLLKAISWKDPDLQMPPKEKMPDGEIAVLTEWIAMGVPWPAGAAAPAGKKEKPITDADRGWWSFQPIAEPAPPAVKNEAWCRTDVDRFLLRTLETEGLAPAPEADRTTLIRRATYDLHGLPPTPDEVEAFLQDPAPDAWERLVDRLLASPRYGERQARRWLDLVRYAESDGYKQDAYRPNAWPYRDYVIRAFNEDKPYDRFVAEQLAGDELAPDDPGVVVATGFLRHGIYEYNQRNAAGQWRDIQNDVTDVTGDVFLGLGMGCARCHDHKFDPILQADYFRLQSFFAATIWRDDLPLATPDERAEAAARQKAWEAKTAAIRAEIDAIERPFIANAEKSSISKFLPELQAIQVKPISARSPYERQVGDLIDRQVIFERTTIDGKIKGAQREKWSALKRQLAEHDALKPKELPPALVVSDVGRDAATVTIPGTARVIEPGFLAVLNPAPPDIRPGAASSGRRSALARWLTGPANPLAARVMVNRIWQGHFGRGLVATASDFGRLGEKPSHPELLDWLAARFRAGGWSVKKVHRLLMTSAAYRQSGRADEAARLQDPDNRWLWRMSPRRLEAEEVRDAMLATAGELEPATGGPSVDPNLPRRTIYTKVLRNTRDPLLEAFDSPENFSSVPSRSATTTATQSLLLINGRWPLERAQAFAKRLRALKTAGDADLAAAAWRLAYGRPPSPGEIEAALAFLRRSNPAAAAAADIPLTQTMPDRGGQAARFRSAHVEDRLRLAGDPIPDGDFTVEAVLILDSLFEDAAVRTIASQWAGDPKKPGWSFGITSVKSKHQPRNLILQLIGNEGYEVVASDLRLELHKTHYVSAAVRFGEGTVAFTMLDLSDPEAQIRSATVRHKTTSIGSPADFVIGGRDGPPGHGWDGLIDEVRLARGAVAREQSLIGEAAPPELLGHWKFEIDPGFFADSAGRRKPLGRPRMKSGPAASDAGLADFCHVLLNSNEFLYVD